MIWWDGQCKGRKGPVGSEVGGGLGGADGIFYARWIVQGGWAGIILRRPRGQCSSRDGAARAPEALCAKGSGTRRDGADVARPRQPACPAGQRGRRPSVRRLLVAAIRFRRRRGLDRDKGGNPTR